MSPENQSTVVAAIRAPAQHSQILSTRAIVLNLEGR